MRVDIQFLKGKHDNSRNRTWEQGRSDFYVRVWYQYKHGGKNENRDKERNEEDDKSDYRCKQFITFKLLESGLYKDEESGKDDNHDRHDKNHRDIFGNRAACRTAVICIPNLVEDRFDIHDEQANGHNHDYNTNSNKCAAPSIIDTILCK